MGLDSPDVRRILHWGAPADIESYIQETGGAGRDGEQSSAKLYYAPVNLHPLYTEDSMKQYCLNKDTCRRKLLLRDFDTLKEILIPSPLCTCCVHAVTYVLSPVNVTSVFQQINNNIIIFWS